MTSLKKLFSFFDNQDHVDRFGSGVGGVVLAGGVATVVGILAHMPYFGAIGLAVQSSVSVLTMPFLFASGEKFKPKIFAASATLALAGIFGLSAALHVPSANEEAEYQATNAGLTLIEQVKESAPSPK